jgi:hypothetical protein
VDYLQLHPPSAIGFAGMTNTEEYNGTSWTAGGALPAANRGSAATGVQTAALSAGGITGLTL